MTHKARASAEGGIHTHRAKRYRLNLRDTKGFINGLPEFQIRSMADVHKFHIGRHTIPAGAAVKAELIDVNDFGISAAGIEFLNADIKRCFTAGKVRIAFPMGCGPLVRGFHVLYIIGAAGGSFSGKYQQHSGLVFMPQ